MNFKEFIKNDREGRNSEKFKGTFIDYLEIVKADPDIVKLSHKRIYDMVVSKGIEVIKGDENARLRKIHGNDVIRKYGFFRDEFYGIDKVIMKMVNYFHSAAMKGEEARQVLYLVGPVGAGKSSLVEALKRALVECDAIYSIQGCPMHEDPLHLIPRHLRAEFEELLGIQIEGDLCPVCRYRLMNEFNGEYENFPVETKTFSIRSRKGIGVVPPVDPNNQDTSQLPNKYCKYMEVHLFSGMDFF